MTTTELPRPTTPSALDAVGALAPAISARADEIERGRRVPGDLIAELHAAGCFRMLLPSSLGGSATDLPTALRVFEALARADASTGWIVALGSSAWCDLLALPRATFEALDAARDGVVVGGVFNPTGSVTAVADGYRASGRWAFASGCEHCTWIYGNCIEEVDGDHRIRTVVFARDEVEIEDTWRAVGLCGTGSHHIQARDVLVPPERTCLPFEDEPTIDTPLARIPAPALFALEVTSVALGVAAGALDDITALACDKVPLLGHAPLAADPLFQAQLALADTELHAARTALHAQAELAWATAVERAELTREQRARLRATATWATGRAAAVVDAAYLAGGATSLRSEHPLQRRLRDVRAITQHFLVRPDTMVTAGAVLAGQEADLSIF
jgi:indole-3-acetate monooxygenase